MIRIARATAVIAAIGAAMLLGACTTPSGSGGGPKATPTRKEASPPKQVEPSALPIEAVLVVASVDVDGRHVTASGYIQGVVTDSGTCTFTFHGSGSEFTVDHEATADRMTTSCGSVQPPIENFRRGSWEVTVGFPVNGKTYTSEPTTVEVP
jgi:hypothetical protein